MGVSQGKTGRGKRGTHVVTRKRLTLNNNLVPAIDIRPIKRRQNKMQIRRQRLHDRNLRRRSPHKGRHSLRRRIISVQPRRQRGVGEGLEVALHALRRPGGQVLVQARGDAAGLQTERVAAQVDAFVM